MPEPEDKPMSDGQVMRSMYEVDWVKKLLGQIQECLQHNGDWLGIEAAKPQRVLDYACGNGTVTTALLEAYPQATFRGIDILESQVTMYNEEAVRILGEGHHDRMHAVTGNLNELDKTPFLRDAEWFGFDCLVISFALHHVEDPVDFLKILRDRVRPGGTLVVVDWLKHEDDDKGGSAPGEPATASSKLPREKKYDPEDMTAVPMGKIWPGFSLKDIEEDYEAAGLEHVEVRVWPDMLELPQHARVGGRSTMYVSKAVRP